MKTRKSKILSNLLIGVSLTNIGSALARDIRSTTGDRAIIVRAANENGENGVTILDCLYDPKTHKYHPNECDALGSRRFYSNNEISEVIKDLQNKKRLNSPGAYAFAGAVLGFLAGVPLAPITFGGSIAVGVTAGTTAGTAIGAEVGREMNKANPDYTDEITNGTKIGMTVSMSQENYSATVHQLKVALDAI